MSSSKAWVVDGPRFPPDSAVGGRHIFSPKVLFEVLLDHWMLVKRMFDSHLVCNLRFTDDQRGWAHGPHIEIVEVAQIILLSQPQSVMVWMDIRRKCFRHFSRNQQVSKDRMVWGTRLILFSNAGSKREVVFLLTRSFIL